MFLYSSCALQRITLARSGSVSSASSPALSLLSDWRYIEYCCTRSSLIKPPCVCCIWCFRHASYLYRRQQNLHFRGRILMIKWYCWNLCCVFLYGTNLYDAIFSNATDWVTPIRLSAMARVPKMTRKKIWIMVFELNFWGVSDSKSTADVEKCGYFVAVYGVKNSWYNHKDKMTNEHPTDRTLSSPTVIRVR